MSGSSDASQVSGAGSGLRFAVALPEESRSDSSLRPPSRLSPNAVLFHADFEILKYSNPCFTIILFTNQITNFKNSLFKFMDDAANLAIKNSTMVDKK